MSETKKQGVKRKKPSSKKAKVEVVRKKYKPVPEPGEPAEPAELEDIKLWAQDSVKDLKQTCKDRGMIQSGNKSDIIIRLYTGKRKVPEDEAKVLKERFFNKNPELTKLFTDLAEGEEGFKAISLNKTAALFKHYPFKFTKIEELKGKGAVKLKGVGKGALERIEDYFLNGPKTVAPVEDSKASMSELASSSSASSENPVDVTLKKLFAGAGDDGLPAAAIREALGGKADQLESLVEQGTLYATVDEETFGYAG